MRDRPARGGWRGAAKRVIDVIGSGVALVMLAPLLVAVAAAVRVALGRPVLFHQQRAGRHGQPFQLVKFRTMLPQVGATVDDAGRLTPFGRWLRVWSLDELPQLWNVLRGDMSLVGPRPLFVDYIPLYSSEQARRLEIRPGLTGWAQIHGRNAVNWPRRLAFDVWYVDSWSLRLDLRILLATVGLVLRRSGVTQAGHATVERFRGND